VSEDEILARLEERYDQSATLRGVWAAESEDLRRLLAEIGQSVAGQYELEEPLGVGGSAIVLRVRDVRLGVDRALKFPRPSPGKQQLLAEFLAAETERLVELSHPYLMRIHAKGTVALTGTDFPYYVMDLYAGTDDADDYIARDGVTEEHFVQLLERILEALCYMHGQGKVHLDIKPGNILVRPGNEPVISDLGFAKVLQDDSGLTMIGGTEGFIHPDARRFIVEASSDPNRLRGEALRAALRPSWDLYSLGRTILRLLEVIDSRQDRPLSLYTHRYLKLLACRLLDGKNAMDETLLGLSRMAFEEVKYSSASEALRDVRKLTGGYNLEARIPELNQFGPDTIQASTFSTTPLTSRVKALLEQDEVARLGGFTQLSLLNLVYPTATHTRLEHVIGAFSAMCRYITALYRDPINPLFRQIMTEEDILAALLVALVHDVGHYALAHDLEEAEEAVFSHEARGKELLRDGSTGLQEIIEAERLPNGAPGWGVPVVRLLAILEADVPKMRGSVKERLIHALIDGPIDADKLDYIIRDSNNLGLTYGSVIDVERLLRVLTVVSRQSGEETHVNVGIHEKGRVTAEAVAFARYALYGSVYWHHAYRGVKAMLQRIAWEYLERVDKADKTKHEGIVKAVKRELYSALRANGGGAPQTLPLTSTTGGGQLHPGDKAVLEWLATRSGDCGRALATLIEERELFKRVLVVSRWGNESLWRSVTDLMADKDWRRKLAFQRAFQDRMATAIERVEGLAVHTALVLPDARNAFLAAHGAHEVLVLVDATQPRPGASSGLEIIQEEDRRRAKIDEMPVSKPEQSSVWESLRTNLHETLGKVRVVCHPQHVRFVSALSRELVESALDQAVRAS
jgi:HD superfamily phosphohydrolase